MLYEFRLVGGTEIIRENFPMADAPEPGTLIHRNGKTYMRVVSAPQISAAVADVCRGYPYESHTFGDMGDAAEKSPRGLTVVRSQRHEKELCAMTDRKRV